MPAEGRPRVTQAERAGAAAGGVERGVEAGEDVLGGSRQVAAGRGERHAAGGALDQPDTDGRFELGDGPADGRLARLPPGGGVGERACLRQHDQGAQLAKI